MSLMATASNEGWTLQNEKGAIVEIAPSLPYFADETVSLREAAKAGLGLACLASGFCEPLMPHRRGQLPSVRMVADHLIKELSQRPLGADLINAD
jgi:DNA-binding transcriptional LysR family regulator